MKHFSSFRMSRCEQYDSSNSHNRLIIARYTWVHYFPIGNALLTLSAENATKFFIKRGRQMFQALFDDGGALGYVLAAGAVLLGVLGVVGELGRGSRLCRALPVGALLLGGVAACFFEDLRTFPYIWLPATVLAFAVLLCYVIRTSLFTNLLRKVYLAAQRPCASWSVLGAFGLAVGVGLYFELAAALETPLDVNTLPPQLVDDHNLKAVATSQGVTDRGRPVPLFSVEVEPLPERRLLEIETPTASLSHLTTQLIRLGPPDPAYNCHGWLFLGGQYWIRGRHVEPILEDNGYQPVSVPRVGDVAIFRDGLGNVTHSAIVRGLTANDTAILESKWGWGSRYLHVPQAQIYSASWTFYRTERHEGHRLRLLVDPPEIPLPRVAG